MSAPTDPTVWPAVIRWGSLSLGGALVALATSVASWTISTTRSNESRTSVLEVQVKDMREGIREAGRKLDRVLDRLPARPLRPISEE